jgi:hypothetical protein
VLRRYKHDLVVKEKPEWLKDDFWNQLGEHIKQEDVKAKSKFMSDIAGGCPPTYGLGPITAVNVGAELVSHCLIGRVFHFYLLIS